jgi:hypothetical protein
MTCSAGTDRPSPRRTPSRPSLVGGAAATLLALAACDRPEAAAPPAVSPATPAPVSTTPKIFVGRWAARPELCRSEAWIITADQLRTPDGVVCRLGAAQGEGPVEVAATCTAKGVSKPSRLRFAYAESAGALLIENGPFADVGLVRCPAGADTAPEPIPPGEPGGLPDDCTPVAEAPFAPGTAQGAADVLQTYFADLEVGHFADAYRLWSDDGRASGMTAAAFAASFAGYDGYHAQIGAPGRVEGAAGSLYVQVQVQVYARRKSGESVHRSGVATLRRVNDVPGASAEQRRWRIYRLELQPSGR